MLVVVVSPDVSLVAAEVVVMASFSSDEQAAAPTESAARTATVRNTDGRRGLEMRFTDTWTTVLMALSAGQGPSGTTAWDQRPYAVDVGKPPVGVAADRQTAHVILDDEQCYARVRSRDPRFDGMFVTAVRTTGIYCRPSCPATTPRRANVEFHLTAAAAQGSGFRACKRCRPDATPGSPEWNTRSDVVGRAMRLIADGIVDRDGVGGLAGRLGYGERQLQRILQTETGATPVALARAQRAQTARLLIETTDLPITEIAFAAGFGSVRQFNDTVRDVFALSPRDLRAAARHGDGSAAQGVTVRLAHREPLDRQHLLDFLGRRAVPGVEHVDGTVYSRSLRLPRGAGTVSVDLVGTGPLFATFRLADIGDLRAALQRVRRLLDLDADPLAVTEHLSSDPVGAALVAARPGLRSPGHPDGGELLVRAVLGQQISVSGARTLAARLVERLGEPLPPGVVVAGVDRLFPSSEAIGGCDPDSFSMPSSRGRALVDASLALASGALTLDPGVDWEDARRALLAVRGIGPWTADYVAMRALGDPDVFLPADVGVRHALAALDGHADPTRWAPWRSYAVHHLWASLPDTSHPTGRTSP
ncbi:MAG: hypothetical protein RJB65_2364 [Actinomycetota bacterium]